MADEWKYSRGSTKNIQMITGGLAPLCPQWSDSKTTHQM